jgi:hypothetical protein
LNDHPYDNVNVDVHVHVHGSELARIGKHREREPKTG